MGVGKEIIATAGADFRMAVIQSDDGDQGLQTVDFPMGRGLSRALNCTAPGSRGAASNALRPLSGAASNAPTNAQELVLLGTLKD